MINYHSFGTSPDIAILIKPSSFSPNDLLRYYIKPSSISQDHFMGIICEYFEGKVRAKQAKEWLKELIPFLKQNNIKYLYIADAEYFKLITGKKKAQPHLGDRVETEDFITTYGINYSSTLYNPDNINLLTLSVKTLKDIYKNSYSEIGKNIIHFEEYFDDTALGLKKFCYDKPELTIDIETTSLSFWETEIVSIGFAWDKHHGIVIDYPDIKELTKFFKNYQGKCIYHNGAYDIKILIWHCFMNKQHRNIPGLLQGVDCMFKNYDDSIIRAYLCLNSTTKPSYSLKDLAHEFTGNYVIDVTNILALHKSQRLTYNLIDCLATWYVYENHVPDNPELHNFYLETQKILTYTELCGMPTNMDRILEADKELIALETEYLDIINSYPEIDKTLEILTDKAVSDKNAKLKKKRVTAEDFNIEFNPNSSVHLTVLLYTVLDLPVISYTDRGNPSCDGDTLLALINHISEDNKGLLETLKKYTNVQKIITSFIPALKKSILTPDGYVLYGNFKLIGTLSGRLSSNSPNLQNIPSGSEYGKLIKSCFSTNQEWIFCGADFNALEDVINTLLTKDPNKLKIWLNGIDGHCFRAYAYWADLMPDIRCNEEAEHYYQAENKQGEIIRFTSNDTELYNNYVS